MKPVLIGIAGGSCSGKTSISRTLFEYFEKTNSVVIIKEDDYYKSQKDKTWEEKLQTNYDHPLAFDHELLVTQLKDLLNRKSIVKPTYDYTIHDRSDITEIIEPADVIILEGLFALEPADLRDIEDIKIFVQTDSDERFVRRLKRDIKERARTPEQVMDQYLTTVKPMYDEFIEPTKRFADLIIPRGKSNTVAIDLLITKISSILNDKML